MRIQVEELLTQVETRVAQQYKSGLPAVVGEIYMLTDRGLTRLVFAERSKKASAKKLESYVKLVEAMTVSGKVHGVVQVATAWMSQAETAEDLNSDPKDDPGRKEVLVFNGSNPSGNRVRVYEIKKLKGRRQAVTLSGAYNVVQFKGGGAGEAD